jgi:hypothetical protein
VSASDKAARAGLLILALATSLYSPRATAQVLADVSTAVPQPKENDKDTDKDTTTNDGWHFAITPYIWFAGVHGTAGALGHEVSVHASFSDIFNYLNIGAMGVFETRYKRVLMPLDFMWMKLSDEKGIPITDDVVTLKATMKQTMLTPRIGYRIADGKKVKVDALVGIRYWHLNTELRASAGGAQVFPGISQSADWVDAVAGGRIILALTPKAFVVVAGDAGGGSARSDYEVGGFLGYKVSRKWDLLAGYRYLSINYRPNGGARLIYNVNMPGMLLGARYNFK